MIIFAESCERPNTITVDGYTDKKTIRGAVKDIGRFIEKVYHNGEGEHLIKMVNEGISETNNPFIKAVDADSYFFDIEEVPCATRCGQDGNVNDYADANYYFCIRFVK